MFAVKPWHERVYDKVVQYQTAEIEIIAPGLFTEFNVTKGTGGFHAAIVVYKGKARIQQYSNNRDQFGTDVRNPSAEVAIRIQIDPKTGWADSFTSPASYTNSIGARRVLRDWKVRVTNGASNPGLTKLSYSIDSSVDSNFQAVMNLNCSALPDIEVS